MVFGWTQIIMDIQPLVVIFTGQGHLHGFSHTYLGATLLGIACALSGKYLAQFGLRLMDRVQYLPISWTVAITSALIGSFSHVLLDSLMHADVEPFAPFMQTNPFLGFISIETLHKFCLYSGLIGAGLYLAVSSYLKKRTLAAKPHV